MGFAALSEGNVIRLGEFHIGVTEACSGLSMLVVFFALSTGVAILMRRPLLDKFVIFLSAVPIALAANIVRVAVTAALYQVAGERLAKVVFHDLAGWLMMPLGLVMLWAELRLLSWILIPRSSRRRTASRMMVRDIQSDDAVLLGTLSCRSVDRTTPAGTIPTTR